MSESFEKFMHTITEQYVNETNECDRLISAYTAGLLRAGEVLCANCKSEGLNVMCDFCTDLAAIRKELEGWDKCVKL